MRSGKYGEADHVDVFLQRGVDDLFGCLPEAGIDHFEAGVAKGAGDYLRAAVVAIQAGLGNQYADLLIHQNIGSS